MSPSKYKERVRIKVQMSILPTSKSVIMQSITIPYHKRHRIKNMRVKSACRGRSSLSFKMCLCQNRSQNCILQHLSLNITK